MGVITIDDFTSSVAYREIFGLGRHEGEQKGRQAEAAAISLRLLGHRCGTLSPSQQPAFRPSRSARSKLFSTPCSTSRDQKTSTPS